MTEISMWDGPSGEIAAERTKMAHLLTASAAEPLWPFLSGASTPAEFEQRLALSTEGLKRAASIGTVGEEVTEAQLVATAADSLRERFAALHRERTFGEALRAALAGTGENGQCPQYVEGVQCRFAAGHNPPHLPAHNEGEVSVGEPSDKVAAKTASWLDAARDSVEGKGFKMVDTNGNSVPTKWRGDDKVSGGIVLDMTTANMLLTIHDALSPAKAAEFAAMPIEKAVTIGWKLVERKSASKTASWEADPSGLHTIDDGTLAEFMGHPVDIVVSTGIVGGEDLEYSGRITDFDEHKVYFAPEYGGTESFSKDRIEAIHVGRDATPRDPAQIPMFASKQAEVQAAPPGGYAPTGKISEHPCDTCGTPVAFERYETVGGLWAMEAVDSRAGSDYLSTWCPEHRPARRAASAVQALLESEAANAHDEFLPGGHLGDEEPKFEVVADGDVKGQYGTREDAEDKVRLLKEDDGIDAEIKELAKTGARDTGTCGECGRGISYDSSSRSWTHDNEGADTDHKVTKAAALEVCPECQGDTSTDCEACGGKGVKTASFNEGGPCYNCYPEGSGKGWTGGVCDGCNGSGVDKTPYGTGGDHCPWCGADWRQEHRDGCQRRTASKSAVAALLASEAAFFHAPQAPNASPFPQPKTTAPAGKGERDLANAERVRREEQARVMQEQESKRQTSTQDDAPQRSGSRKHAEDIATRLDGLAQSDDFGGGTQPLTTRPRVMPNDGGGDPSEIFAPEAPPTPQADNPDFANGSAMTPTVGQRMQARVARLSSRIRTDNPSMSAEAAHTLAVRTVRSYPEMIGSN